MKLIELAKSFPDGRTLQYHRVCELSITVNEPTMMVVVGSWSSKEMAASQAVAEATVAIPMPYSQQVSQNILGEILRLPGWAGGKIVDG